MSLNYDQAIEALRNTPATQEALLDLARQVSVHAEGAVTVLYSGTVADGIKASDIVTNMLTNGEDIRVVDRSDAAKFLQSDDFLANAILKGSGSN